MRGAFPNDSPEGYQKVLLVKDSSVGLINEEHKLKCSSHLLLEYQGKIVFSVSGPILIGFSRRFTKLKMNETA